MRAPLVVPVVRVRLEDQLGLARLVGHAVRYRLQGLADPRARGRQRPHPDLLHLGARRHLEDLVLPEDLVGQADPGHRLRRRVRLRPAQLLDQLGGAGHQFGAGWHRVDQDQ